MRFKPPAHCVACGLPMAARKIPGHVRHRAGGLCEGCWKRAHMDVAVVPTMRECDRCGIRRQVRRGRLTNLCTDCLEVVKAEGVLDRWMNDARRNAA